MARSPFTLAASITSALPQVGVIGVGELTERMAGRYDSAVADLDDGRRIVVRVPVDPATARELTAEAHALRALTPGVRSVLPFRAPELLGETTLDGTRAVVVDYLPGYRVDAAHLPAGRGAATSLGRALAALHALPTSVVRGEGLPVRTPAQVREDVVRLIERAEATGVLPAALSDRWHRALGAAELWRFESSVVLDGVSASSFLFTDIDDAPEVTGLLEWHGLSVGDPATDLQWLASAPQAADDVFAAYVAHSDRAPDARTRDRARFYAELEFAKWLIHGHESDQPSVVDDAVGLLESLAANVAGEDLVTEGPLDVDDALALLERMPAASAQPVIDTSMQTDAYDPEQLSQWIADEDESRAASADDPDAAQSAPSGLPESTPEWMPDDVSTAPVELVGNAAGAASGTDDDTADAADTSDAAADAERASDAALRRWLTE